MANERRSKVKCYLSLPGLLTLDGLRFFGLRYSTLLFQEYQVFSQMFWLMPVPGAISLFCHDPRRATLQGLSSHGIQVGACSGDIPIDPWNVSHLLHLLDRQAPRGADARRHQ